MIWGGSNLRPEATGYGSVYFANDMLSTRGESPKGKIATVSGSGNVAQYTVEKLNHAGRESGHDVGFGRHHRGSGWHQR